MDSDSATPRRSQRIQKMASPTPISPSTANGSSSEKTVMTARRTPYLPTTVETILLSVYPIILCIGSLFALLDPSTRASPYNATTQSHQAATAPSYFAKKSNVFNTFFVKQGWAWVTFSYFFFLFTHPSTGPSLSPAITPRRLRGIFRYGIVTVWWIFVTQWFFGPAIIDRGFRLTGGQCELVDQAEKGNVDMDDARQLVTGMACKAVGGKWGGGHDISGHVFLLVLGSMFLFEEVLHVVLKSAKSSERTIYMADGAVKSADVEAPRDSTAETAGQWTLGAKVVLGVAGLSVYMLLMTAAYFHTWFEKFTGLLVAFSGIFVVYSLPRFVPALRGIIGMPGV
ncbi:FIT family protein [Lachnellula hyalina]|uniref:Acyl-coenzyme A diphosphatase SCS3 n=1 Tax=Lachnellula hyalina TaxID=1316788 RepID=A0A8H8QW59_9HELO|nr:FIT family protein [Lachnellula hyalina]TVY23641.1 FIT family protein [Lachnellula hyalina]